MDEYSTTEKIIWRKISGNEEIIQLNFIYLCMYFVYEDDLVRHIPLNSNFIVNWNVISNYLAYTIQIFIEIR